MAEQLYTIPVNEAFLTQCECPLCLLHRQLEENAIEYTMGPSYMEDDNRELTDKSGFCSQHIKLLYSHKNKLGLALMLNTHLNKTINDLKSLSESKSPSSNGLFKRSKGSSVQEYTLTLEKSCFVCDRINNTFNRYVDTLFHLWKKDPSFHDKFKDSAGFCIYHYGMLHGMAEKKLSGDACQDFTEQLNRVFFRNIERVNSDISWFIDKFDYRYKNEPWKNSKDALPRGIIKTNHTFMD